MNYGTQFCKLPSDSMILIRLLHWYTLQKMQVQFSTLQHILCWLRKLFIIRTYSRVLMLQYFIMPVIPAGICISHNSISRSHLNQAIEAISHIFNHYWLSHSFCVTFIWNWWNRALYAWVSWKWVVTEQSEELSTNDQRRHICKCISYKSCQGWGDII